MIRFRSSWRWLGAALALTVVGGCEDDPSTPDFDSADDPPTVLSLASPKAFILPIGTGLSLQRTSATRQMPTFFASAGSEVTVYNAIPDPLPGSYPSLGFQATSTDEFGDLVALTRPGVASTITVGMNSWACENDDTRANDAACETSPGASYSHDLTLNLYSVDYSGAEPAVGALLGTVTQAFDIPFRPSWDSTECTDVGDAGSNNGDTPTSNIPFGGRWYAEDLGACVNGYAFTVTFDLSGLDVVLPPEVIYGVAYDTQTHGETPIGTSGPYNSLNVGVANLSAGSLGQPTVGTDVESDAVFWDTGHGPFYTDGGTAGVDVFRRDTGWDPITPVIAMSVTNDGHVSGGGWFTSPVGALTGTGFPEWTFNAEPPYVTPAGFSDAEASAGSSSLYVEPITNDEGNQAKFALQYNPAAPILVSDFEDFSVDFLIDAAGSNTDANQFYVNVYTLTPDPSDGGWYDCRFDYIASTGSTANWTALAVTPSTAPGATGDKLGGSCPATLGGMPAGSTIFRITVNLGDTSGSDTDVGGYFDNAMITVAGESTTWDFEGASGRASFGFVSRYKKGANTPTGNTQFTFKAGDLDFHSTTYDWLVVNQGNSNAQFKGTGTINQQASPTGDDFRFMIWAGDGDPDTFRIKIWYEAAGSEWVVYDNGFDQAIEGGQIVVHTSKKK